MLSIKSRRDPDKKRKKKQKVVQKIKYEDYDDYHKNQIAKREKDELEQALKESNKLAMAQTEVRVPNQTRAVQTWKSSLTGNMSDTEPKIKKKLDFIRFLEMSRWIRGSKMNQFRQMSLEFAHSTGNQK